MKREREGDRGRREERDREGETSRKREMGKWERRGEEKGGKERGK